MGLRSVLLASAAFALPTFAAAQGAFELEELVVTPGLLPVEAGRTGSTVEVLEPDTLETGPITLDDALERLPGVTATRAGTAGANTDIRLRGLPQRYTGVTIDGIDVIDPSAPQAALNFGTITRTLANRVEVVKGAQTAVYGSEAIGGTVTIEGWRPTRDGFSWASTAEAGSYETFASTFSLGYLGDAGEAALTLGAVTSEGFSARLGNDEDDGFDQRALSFRLSRDVSDRVTLGLNGFWADSRVEDDDTDTDPTGVYFEEKLGLRAFAEVELGGIDHTFAVTDYSVDRRDPTGFNQNFEGGRTGLSYVGRRDLASGALAFGADWTEETSDVDGDKSETETWAVFGEVQYALGERADVSAALRYDEPDTTDGAVSGRVALAYRLTEATTVTGVLATGFRAPSLYERFGPFGADDLTPERSRTAEIGVAHAGAGWGVEAVAFRNEIDDLIGFGALGYEQVPGETVSQGVELSGSVALGRATLFGAYTYTDSEGPGGARSLRVPRHDLVLGVEAMATDRLGGSLSARHVSDRLDIDGATFATVKADDYTVVDAMVRYDVTDEAEVYLRVENLFDEGYEEILGYAAPGRSVYVGVRAAF